MGDSSSSSSISTSSLSSDRRRRRGRRRRRRGSSRDRDERRKSNDDDAAPRTTTISLPPAPSDWDELRSHFRFVLPDDDGERDDDGDDAADVDAAADAAVAAAAGDDREAERRGYGSTWQERMVKRYHAGLYKERVLADLSRVESLGKVGLRWRTGGEVAGGRGFRSCGNLACDGGGDDATASGEGGEAYRAAARRHVGIGVAENGGREPMGVVLPTDDDALESYLKSCAREGRRTERRDSKRRRKRGGGGGLKKRERNEKRRLSRLPHGAGLHDYEVDFAYVERGERKRELVKCRLCLRCAPLLFVAKTIDPAKNDNGEGKERNRRAPALKAREAREAAARSHAAVARSGAREGASSRGGTDETDRGMPEEVEPNRNSPKERVVGAGKNESRGGPGSEDDQRKGRVRRRRSRGGRRPRKKRRSAEYSDSSSSSESRSHAS